MKMRHEGRRMYNPLLFHIINHKVGGGTQISRAEALMQFALALTDTGSGMPPF